MSESLALSYEVNRFSDNLLFRISRKGAEHMDSENSMFRWLDGLAVLFALCAVFQMDIFFAEVGFRRMLMLTMIEFLVFAAFAIVYRKRSRSNKWAAFFVRLAGGLLAIDLLFLFIFNDQAAQTIFSRFADWSGDWLPVFLALPIAIYSILKTYIRERRSSRS